VRREIKNITLYENDKVLCPTVYSFSYLVVTDTVMSVSTAPGKKVSKNFKHILSLAGFWSKKYAVKFIIDFKKVTCYNNLYIENILFIYNQIRKSGMKGEENI